MNHSHKKLIDIAPLINKSESTQAKYEYVKKKSLIFLKFFPQKGKCTISSGLKNPALNKITRTLLKFLKIRKPSQASCL